MRKQIGSRKKAVAAGTAVTLAATIMLSGTFAWQSLNQTAKNELDGDAMNPGGRLHDYFNGENKDVFVENFTDPNENGVPIFARVRLDEYMELGEGAGEKNDTDGTNKAVSLVPGADIDDVTTWTTHKPGATLEDCKDGDEPIFHEYFTWKLGGQTVYMPTFDKNKDSLQADINGTYQGAYGDPFDDYVEYEVGDEITQDAVYDNDRNNVDEGAGALNPENITTKEETHTAAQTKNATVITMQQWMDGGKITDSLTIEPCQLGDFWVYDEDGWAYWANPIQPGETTGLLLDGIDLVSEPLEDWYYSINVVAQFATAGDWGEKDNTGFYDSDKGLPPTDNARFLLNQAAKLLEVNVTAAGDATTIQTGNTLQFTAKLGSGTVMLPETTDVTVTWEVVGAKSESTTISESGLLTVGADESATQLVIKARATGLTTRYGQYVVTVEAAP